MTTKLHTSPQRWLFALFLLLFSALAYAGGGTGGSGSGTGSSPNQSTGDPGDDVTGAPLTDNSPGLTLVGTVTELRALQLQIAGNGRMAVSRLGRGVVAVTLVGDYRVQASRRALAVSNVQFLFRGSGPFSGGLAQLTIGSSAPVVLPPERVPLPVVRLSAAPRMTGDLLVLDVWGLRGQRAHVAGNFAPDVVTLVQRMN